MTLAPGARLGPYEVLGPLGAGGMGEVYRARDTRLGREVAVKVLPRGVAQDEKRLRRFEQEARSASALNHPNIVTIYDVGDADGVSWIAMELVAGATLRELLAGGRLPVDRALAIGAQVAEGLARAHAAGIVHRDLKPENVMVTPDGLAKILDFGLAKPTLAIAADASEARTDTQQTMAGAIVGTVGYMSPEQASARTVDYRSDQFALGAILYEMATGQRAFQGRSATETLAAILREQPAPLTSLNPGAPEPLEWIVRRCLAKQPDERYDSSRDLVRDLTSLRDRGSGLTARSGGSVASPAAPRRARLRLWAGVAALVALIVAAAWLLVQRRLVRTPAAGAERSIAVLPFQNVGGRAEDEYFADGITDALIGEVARARDLLVIARNSAFQFKGASPDVRAVGAKLGVRYVLEGSVQRAGDSVRVNAQLVDAATGYGLWAEKYDRPLKQVFAVQDDISRNVVAALELALTPQQGAAGPPTANLEAYDAFLRGTFFANSFGWVEKDKAVPFLERAVALDPRFAAAHAALAQQYTRRGFEKDPDRRWQQQAFVELEKALALDPGLASAYLVRANLSWTLANHFPHEKTAADLRRAIELNPSLAGAHSALGSLYLHTGLLDRALAEYRLALRIDPHDLDSLYRVPRIHLYQQRYAEALAEFEATPEFRADFQVPLTLAHLARIPDALALANRALTNPTHRMEHYDRASTRAVVLALAGKRREAEKELAAAEAGAAQGSSHFHHAAYGIATAYALLGRRQEALGWLRRTAEEGMPCYPLMAKDPFLDSLRGDAEFDAFLAGLEVEWRRLSAVL